MTQTTSFQALRACHDNELQRAQARHAALEAVFGDLDQSNAAPTALYDHGYCADVSLVFEAKNATLAGLLASYPAEPVVLVRDACVAQKPESHLRDEDKRASVLHLAPLLFKAPRHDAPSACWWTRLRSGMLAQVQLKNATMADYRGQVAAPRFHLDSHTYATGHTTFGRRALAPVQTESSALESWLDSWDQFAKDEGYAGGQLQFAKAIRGFIAAKDDAPDWRAAGLPQAHFAQAGSALQVPPGREMAEYLEELQAKERDRPAHWMDRIGQFWRFFDAAGAERFWAFCLRQADEWPGMWQRHQAQVDQVAGAYERFCEAGMPADEPVLREHLLHAVHAATGLHPEVRVVYGSREGRLELDIRFRNVPFLPLDRRAVRANANRPLRPQDLPVAYVA